MTPGDPSFQSIATWVGGDMERVGSRVQYDGGLT